MVQSGLDETLIKERAVPRVSAYRLAMHLGSAFGIYLFSFWQGLECLSPTRVPAASAPPMALRRLRAGTHGLAALVFLTAMTGAFVAGLDAGLVYNEFPFMGRGLVPTDLLALAPTWRNFFENPSAVQFVHRVMVPACGV